MNVKCLYIIVLFLLVFKSECQTSYYQLNVTVNKASVSGYVNGVPIFSKKSMTQSRGTYFVNLHLISGKNKLLLRQEEPFSSEGFVEFSIVPYGQSEIINSNDQVQNIVSGTLNMENDSKTWQFEITNVPFFDYLFLATPEVTEKEVANYAEELLSLMKQNNVRGLVEQMEPKLKDVSSITGQSVGDIISTQYKIDKFRDKYLGESSVLKSSEELDFIPHNQGRIWEIKRKDGNPFFYKQKGGGTQFMDVFVAKIEGQFQIVR